MQALYSYTDYRLYLKDWYTENKQKKNCFSYRYIAEKIGFKSAGHFTQILKGQANISRSLLLRFIKFLKLNKKESDYFQWLVAFNQAATLQEKRLLYEQLDRIKNTSFKLLDPDQYTFYNEWYYSAVRDLLAIYPFAGDYRQLARLIEPSISVVQARKAIELLKRLKLITVDSDGVYHQTDAILSTRSMGHSVALSNYAVEMIDRAKEAVNALPKEERDISWTGFAVSEKTFALISEEISTCRKRILELAKNDSDPERVYHLNIQCFPVSKKYRPEAGNGMGTP